MNPSIQRLAQLMQARREHGEPPYVLLLGSSLSITPAVRRASAGTEDWEPFWREMQRAAPMERKVLLKKPLGALDLKPGYLAMAQLAEVGYFNLILTLNVDDAIDDAVSPLPAEQRVLLIYDGSNSAQIVAALSRARPCIKVVKLRGDINAQVLPLTATGQFEFPDDLERSVSEWLKRDAILVGDIPYDTDVQHCIRHSTGALWCILPDEPASGSFINRVKKVRPHGEIITGVDAEFNKFFTALAVALGMDTVLPSQVAETQKQELYDQGMTCFLRGEWAQVICLFQQILDVDKDYKDAAQILIQAKKQKRLEQLYARVKQVKPNQHWRQMIRVCQEIIAIAPFYRDVQRLLWKARFHSARQRAGTIWARYKTAIGMLAVLLLMAAGIPVLRGWVIVWQPTPTPPTVQVSEEEVVIEINGVRIDPNDDRCREIVCNSSPRIQVTVLDSAGVPLQPDVLSHNWRFDPPDPHNPDRLDSKNYAIIYSVPCDHNNQTVTIEVRKDGRTLCVRRICFNIKKQP